MYPARVTRPDIAYATSTVACYMDKPSSTRWTAVMRIYRYPNSTSNCVLTLGGLDNPLMLFVFSDANWGSQLHHCSISGFVTYVGDGPISWSSKKQPIITLSSTESEYVALTHAAKEIIWLRKLFSELIGQITSPTILCCDNQSAIRLSKDSTFHAHTKHINIHFHFVRQVMERNQADICYVPMDDMIADIFTKSLARMKFICFCSLLNLYISPT